MKTRSFAAKALTAAVLATTVSGYAFAGDHSISVDVSTTPYCSQSYGIDDTTDSFGGNGGCGSSDAQINFSGKMGNGWDYAFNLDPSDWSANAEAAASPVATNAGSDVLGSVAINKDLGNGLTLSFGDTGDGDKLKNYAGHWEGATHSDPGTTGGMQVSYGKGGLDASLTLGSNRALGDDDAGFFSNLSAGAGYTFGKFDVGASYHTVTMSDTAYHNGINKLGPNVEKISAMAFSGGGSFGNYNVGADYLSKTTNACGADAPAGVCVAAATAETKVTAIGAHLWASGGEFRPGFSYTTETEDAKVNVTTTTTVTTKMAGGVAWHPKAGGPSIRFMYQNSKTDGADSTSNPDTKISLKISGSFTVI